MALIDGLRLSRHSRVHIERGRSIIADGRPVTAIYLISEGWAVSKMSIETGDTQILDILGAGSIAGLSRIDESIVDDYSAIALQDVDAYRIEIDALQTVCAADEDLSVWLSETLSRQTQRTQRHLVALGQLPARGRLAFVMLRILDIAQQLGESAVDKTIRLPMTQEEIGNMLGLTNVSISKLMSAFRKEGLIDYGRNRIVVHDVESLSEICGMGLEEIRVLSPRHLVQ
ncbi:MAG: Crp/Fnr family transcriptional regulator, partial [Litorimonas sp.]